jgi:hypothetical protein
MTPVAETKSWQEAKGKVDHFVTRFGNPSYKDLARHAALPLVLTPELVNYLRNEFLRGEAVPWEAEADLLLSDLCSQVGYELYAMETQVRAYLLEEIKDSPFWQQRMREVAQVLFGYVNFLSRMNPEKRQQELEVQRLAAMVYMGDEACQQAVQALAERLKQVSDVAESETGSERGIRAELARLSRITQELAPQLQQTPALVEYAKLVQQVLRSPEAVDPAALQQIYQVGDVALTVSPCVLPTQQDRMDALIEVPGFPLLAVLNFETGQLVEQGSGLPPLQTQTVESVTLFFADQPVPEEAQVVSVLQRMTGVFTIEDRMVSQLITGLKTFLFEIATLEQNPSVSDGWAINRRQGEAQRYEESLGDNLVLEMVAIPSGNFLMGSPEDEPGRQASEGPQHDVRLNSFYMGRYPITQAQWRFVAALPQLNQTLNLNPSRFEGANRPVEQVSWYDAVEFCNRLSRFTQREYRLPTEAEWEYGCRREPRSRFILVKRYRLTCNYMH